MTIMFGLSKEEFRTRLLWGIAVIGFFSYFATKTITNDNKLKSKHNYTVGIIIDKYKGIKQPLPTLKFQYEIDNKKYINAQGFDSEKYHIETGEKFLVMFSPDDKAISRLLLKVRLPDSVQAPIEGWKIAPFGFQGSDETKW